MKRLALSFWLCLALAGATHAQGVRIVPEVVSSVVPQVVSGAVCRGIRTAIREAIISAVWRAVRTRAWQAADEVVCRVASGSISSSVPEVIRTAVRRIAPAIASAATLPAIPDTICSAIP